MQKVLLRWFQGRGVEIGLDPNSQIGLIAYIDFAYIKATPEEMVAAGSLICALPPLTETQLVLSSILAPGKRCY